MGTMLTSAVDQVLTPAAKEFLNKLHQRFDKTRKELLLKRVGRQEEINRGHLPNFLKETKGIRDDASWKVVPPPKDLEQRWVEITGPTDRKMLINALNSGADVFMADFEDALSPTWKNVIEGQANLTEAIERTISFTSPEGKKYVLQNKTALLVVRPRGWHLIEKHYEVDGQPISASLFDFGLFFFHNARRLIGKGTGPYFYLPKLESHLEARLWNDVFNFAEDELKLPHGTIRCTVLIETILAAFEMEEILYELRTHITGLNAGRWDYIFSIIKKFHEKKDFIFPNRGEITMTVPFMRAYTDLLVRTCHKRGAHAMGGMAAFVPSRKDQEVNATALAKVREDKQRECADGFDGTWVAHPDLVPVAREMFEKHLNKKPHQKEILREDVNVTPQQLLDFKIPNGKITEKGLRQNIKVSLEYIDGWLRGIGCAAIENLMEDAATAEISRAQLWQWLHHNATLDDNRKVTPELYRSIADEELRKIAADPAAKSTLVAARRLLDHLVLDKSFSQFLTQLAYDQLD